MPPWRDRPIPARSPLRPVAWAQEQLGHSSPKATYDWLRRHGVPVIANKIHEDVFYRVWLPRSFDPDAALDEVRR